MVGPGDQDAELLQAPLDYPGLDGQADDVLATGFAAARRPTPRRRPGSGTGGRPRKPDTRPTAPKPARTLTPEQRVTKDELITSVTVSPSDQSLVPAGTSLTVAVTARWKDDQGQVVPWDPDRIHVRFFTTTHQGPGPHTFTPAFGARSLVISVDLWSERRKEWKPTEIWKKDFQAFCPVDIRSLSAEAQEFVATLFAEGGATPSVTRNEVVRVAWSFRRRVELVGDLEADAAASPQDVLLRRRLEKVHKYIARNASYRAVLSHSGQFSGFGDARYRIAKDPAKLVTNAEVCGRLTLTREVALGVMDGSITDPYAGAGNPTAPGCLYYMTKEAWAKFTKWNQEHPGEPPKFAPTWDRLPAQNGDKHYYWGMKAEDPFLPP